jgi:hypothetical protein
VLNPYGLPTKISQFPVLVTILLVDTDLHKDAARPPPAASLNWQRLKIQFSKGFYKAIQIEQVRFASALRPPASAK